MASKPKPRHLFCRHTRARNQPIASRLTFILIAFVLLLVSTAQGPPTAAKGESDSTQSESRKHTLLTLAKPVESEVSGQQINSYRINVASDQYLQLFIEASGLDLFATIFGPDGQIIREGRVSMRGRTPISLIAEVDGTYRLDVRLARGDAPSGGYRVGAAVLRRKTNLDAYRVEAELTAAKGDDLSARWRKDTLQDAVGMYENARSLWHAARDQSGEALALKNIGDIYFKLGDARKALDHYRQALALGRRLPERRVEAEVLNAFSDAYNFVGENHKALDSAQRALLVSRASDNKLEEAQALNNIGWAYFALSDMKKALEFFELAISLRHTLNDRRGQAETLLNFGYTHSVLKDTDRALGFYNEALAAWREVGDQLGEALTLTAIGHLHNLLGDRQKALGMYGPAMRLFQSIGNRYGEAITLNGFAYSYEKTGENEKAIEYFNRSLEIARVLGKRSAEAAALNRIGANYYALGDYQKTLDFSQKALLVSRTMADPLMEAYVLGNMGRSYEGLGRKQEALVFYRRALALNRAGGDKGRQADELYSIGHVYQSSGDLRKALALYREALSLYRAAGERSGESLAFFSIAHAERDLGHAEAARQSIEESLRITESLRTDVAGRDLRVSYFASIHKRYEFYTDLLMQLHKQRPGEGFDVAALQASEHGRGRALLETLVETRAELRQGVAPALLERERALREKLEHAVSRQAQLLGDEHRKEEAAAAAKEVDNITLRYEEVMSQLKANDPRYAELVQPQPPSVGEIQRRVLDNQTLLLEYALGDERSYVWVLMQTGVVSYELPGRAQIEEAARRLYGLLIAHQPVAGETANERQTRTAQAELNYWREADALSDMILGPVAEHLANRRLLVVADGALQYIPFGALTTPGVQASDGIGPQRPDGVSRPPLFSRHEIVNLPSASTLLALRREMVEPKRDDKLVAIFADPVFERDDSRVGNRGAASPPADIGEGQSQQHRALRDVSALLGGEGIPRLMASREEAESIAAMLPADEVEKITDFNASHAAATAPSLSRYRVIHFATHGIVNSKRPELSGIVLSLVNEQGEPRDGFLHLHDIYNLNLKADLVVLSACSTGLGKDVKGEGIIGLTRGFMYAGADTIVASLWKVDDEATAELMKLFYEAMFKRELAPSAALREAQLAMWGQKRWRAPYYWAGFVIQGQNAELKVRHAVPQSPWRLVAWCAAASAVSLIALYALRLRRRRTLSSRGAIRS